MATDLNKLCLLDSETSIDVSRNFVARLCDQKGKVKSPCDNFSGGCAVSDFIQM
jgi:hypothetical protein